MKTSTPLLSLDAHGTIAGTITAAKLRGRTCIKRKPTHEDTHTPSQLAERSRVISAGSSWHSSWLKDDIRESWDRYATYRSVRYTGYHAFQSALLREMQISGNPAYPVEVRDYDDGFVAIRIRDPLTGGISSEGGSWQLFAGGNPARLNLTKTVTRLPRGMYLFDMNSYGKPLYAQLWKNGAPRSGIMKWNFEAPSVQDNTNARFMDGSWWSYWPRWILGGGYADYDATRAGPPHTLNQKKTHTVGSVWLTRLIISTSFTPDPIEIGYGTVMMWSGQTAGEYVSDGVWTSTAPGFGHIVAPWTTATEKGKISCLELYDVSWMTM